MLDYNLAEKGELSLYEYLYRRIRDDIAAGVLEAGDRLPSKRSLAQHLGVSLVTVEGAYAQLVAEGYVRSRPRSGCFVNALPGLPPRTALVRKASATQRSEALALAEAAPAASGSLASWRGSGRVRCATPWRGSWNRSSSRRRPLRACQGSGRPSRTT